MTVKSIRVTCLVLNNKSTKDKPKVVTQLNKQYGVLSHKVVCAIHLAFKAIKV